MYITYISLSDVYREYIKEIVISYLVSYSYYIKLLSDGRTLRYYSLSKPPQLTLVVGAKCKDGVVIVGDRKYSDVHGNDLDRPKEKLFGDLRNIVIGFTGVSDTFQIFRRYLVGDVMISRGENDKYTDDNLITKLAAVVKMFNDEECKGESAFEILLARQYPKPELHYIDSKGNNKELEYWPIGSGKEAANLFCKDHEHNEITMLDFVKQAYLAIRYAEEIGKMSSVGVCDKHPNANLFYNGKDIDEEVPKDVLKKYRDEIDETIEEMKKGNKEILKRRNLIK